jgi:hypothetical protein
MTFEGEWGTIRAGDLQQMIEGGKASVVVSADVYDIELNVGEQLLHCLLSYFHRMLQCNLCFSNTHLPHVSRSIH